MKASDFDIELEELHKRSAGRLLTADVFDKAAFIALKEYLCAKAELIKGEHVISKQVVKCLLDVASLIESRVEWNEDVREYAYLANEFYNLLGMMAIGEGCNDRKPGVPRVA
jgi:hypothetical protein